MLCPYCQSYNPTGSILCAKCGKMLITSPFTTKKIVPRVDDTPVPTDSQRQTLARDELLIEVQATGAIIRVKVPETGVIIGRKDERTGYTPEVDLTEFIIHDWGVSRKHCQVVRRGESLFIRDLNSSNGVKLNGIRIAPDMDIAIREGALVTLGLLQIRVFFLPPETPLSPKSVNAGVT